jgi:hypothetical protein
MNNYLQKIINEPKKYISNISDHYYSNINNYNILVLFNNSNKNNTYTTSFATLYQAYSYDELNFYFNNTNKIIIINLLNILLAFINLLYFCPAIYINNLCLSTNLYTKSFIQNISKNYINELINIYKYPIIIRSIYDINQIKYLESLGFNKIVSRKVYIYDSNILKAKHRNHIKKDKNKLDNFISLGYTVHYADTIELKTKITDENIKQFHYLYNKLYLDKYSKYNPQFTVEWIKLFISLSNTGIIFYNIINSAIFEMLNNIYDSCLKLEQPECQIFWALYSQTYSDYIKQVEFNDVNPLWKAP